VSSNSADPVVAGRVIGLKVWLEYRILSLTCEFTELRGAENSMRSVDQVNLPGVSGDSVF
jgi:hypothetical protein